MIRYYQIKIQVHLIRYNMDDKTSHKSKYYYIVPNSERLRIGQTLEIYRNFYVLFLRTLVLYLLCPVTAIPLLGFCFKLKIYLV